jgi:hypothetical protein
VPSVSGVSRSARIVLVGAVDAQVHRARRLQGDGDAQGSGLGLDRARARNADDVAQPALAPQLPDAPGGENRRTASAQPHHHARLHIRHRAVSRLLLLMRTLLVFRRDLRHAHDVPPSVHTASGPTPPGRVSPSRCRPPIPRWCGRWRTCRNGIFPQVALGSPKPRGGCRSRGEAPVRPAYARSPGRSALPWRAREAGRPPQADPTIAPPGRGENARG